jgi:hypothetical protein
MNTKIVADFSFNTFLLLAMIYMLKSSMGINLVKACHAEEVLLANCNTSTPQTITDKMYETYPSNRMGEVSPSSYLSDFAR